MPPLTLQHAAPTAEGIRRAERLLEHTREALPPMAEGDPAGAAEALPDGLILALQLILSEAPTPLPPSTSIACKILSATALRFRWPSGWQSDLG